MSALPHDHQARLERARISLEGLSVADAFGGFFELRTREAMVRYVAQKWMPPAPWRFTDDTNMALSIYEILRKAGHIDQDMLAASFAAHFEQTRGYGMGVRALMSRMRKGEDWRTVAPQMFKGGSFGNGGAMRVTPLGAYFAGDDAEKITEQARLSAEITHAHPEGISGTIAVALAAAKAWELRQMAERPSRAAFIETIIPHVPEGEVRTRLIAAHDLPSTATVEDAVNAVGNGTRVTAQDSAPIVLWAAGENLDDYEAAIWQTASAGGDVDTTCAMVGGIVAIYTGIESIPAHWLQAREPLPDWAFRNE